VTETPVGPADGRSGRHDRRWGVLGGLLGAAVGVGSAAIAVFVEGADPWQSSPYPSFFATREVLSYDVFLAAVIVVGAVLGIATMVLARRSRFPRTDAMGAALTGTILMLLGSALLLARLVAVIRGS
jgi:hypothetical protein